MQPYLYRALTLSALGLIDDAIISYCLSIHFNKTTAVLSKTNRLEVAKVIKNDSFYKGEKIIIRINSITNISVDSKAVDELQSNIKIIVDA